MTSTIKTSNDKLVTKIKNFLKRQKSFCVTTCTNGIYAITIRVIRRFHLTKQQEPKALAA